MALAIALAGCGAPGDTGSGGVDAGGPAREGVLHLGEGQSTFRAIEDGDTLLLARGCQGSQHVWITLRTEGLDHRGVLVDLELVRARDGVSMTGSFRVRLSFIEDEDGEGAELPGVTLQVPEADMAIGEDLVLHGHVEDRVGAHADAERRVRVEWGPEVCNAG